jgi:hypothetical protein
MSRGHPIVATKVGGTTAAGFPFFLSFGLNYGSICTTSIAPVSTTPVLRFYLMSDNAEACTSNLYTSNIYYPYSCFFHSLNFFFLDMKSVCYRK